MRTCVKPKTALPWMTVKYLLEMKMLSPSNLEINPNI